MATNNSNNTYITPTSGQIIKPVQCSVSALLGADKNNVTGDGTAYTLAGWTNVLSNIDGSITTVGATGSLQMGAGNKNKFQIYTFMCIEADKGWIISSFQAQYNPVATFTVH